MPALLSFPIEIVNVCSLTDDSLFRAYDFLLLFVSTTGDQELQQDMERFLARHSPRLDVKSYAICELGNYFGYDDFDFGAEPVLSHFLRAGSGRELVPPFSTDSFPIKD